MTTRFKIERVRRAQGYRSKPPAVDDRQRVSSYTFAPDDLPSERSVIACSGATTTGYAAYLPGALTPGARVIGKQ